MSQSDSDAGSDNSFVSHSKARIVVLDVLNSGLIQRRLLPRLGLAELCSLQYVSPACRQLMASVSDKVWKAAAKRTLPAKHYLAEAEDIHQALFQYCATQQAIRAQEIGTMSVCTYSRPHVDEIICQGELVAVFTDPHAPDVYYEALRDAQHYVFLFHSSSQQPVQELVRPEPFFYGHDWMRYDWSPGDSGHLAIYWALSAGTSRLAMLSKAAAAEREVGHSNRTIQWSPCCQYISMTFPDLMGGTLSIMNTSLEELYCSHTFDNQTDIQSAWSPACTFVGAQYIELDRSYAVGVCWHPSDPDPATSAAALHAKALLAGIGSENWVMRLAWGCSNAMAAVVRVSQERSHGAEGAKRQCQATQYKLYVLLPEHQLASMVLSEEFGFYGTFKFSPTGHQLLVGCGYYGTNLQLVTSTCQALGSFEAHVGAFHPGGQLFCCVGGSNDGRSVKLIRSADGQQMFSMACSNLGREPLRFNALGDQLTLGSRIVLFGLQAATTAKGRQLCRTIDAACRWAASVGQDMIDKVAGW